MKEKEITYRTLRWGPCVIQFKVSDEFKNSLLSEAKKSTTSYGSGTSRRKSARHRYG